MENDGMFTTVENTGALDFDHPQDLSWSRATTPADWAAGVEPSSVSANPLGSLAGRRALPEPTATVAWKNSGWIQWFIS